MSDSPEIQGLTELRQQLDEQEQLLDAIYLAVDGLPTLGDRATTRSRCYRILPEQIIILRRRIATCAWDTRQQDIEAIQSLMGKDCGNWNRAIAYAVEAIMSLLKESCGKESE